MPIDRKSTFLFLFLIVFPTSLLGKNSPIQSPESFEWPKEDPQYKLSQNYSKHKVPPSEGPLHIKASWDLRSILEINEETQTISLDATIRFEWKDPRVTGLPKEGRDYVTLTPRDDSGVAKDVTSKLWMPDFFVDQSKDIRPEQFYLEAASVRYCYMLHAIQLWGRDDIKKVCSEIIIRNRTL